MNDGQDVRKKVTKHIAMNLTVEFATLVSTWAVPWCHSKRSLDGGFERLMESEVRGIVVLGLQHSVCPYVKLLEIPLLSTKRPHIAWFSFLSQISFETPLSFSVSFSVWYYLAS